VAVAQACRRLGHDTLLLVPPSLAAEAVRTGLAYRVGHQPSKAVVDKVWAQLRAGGPESDRGLIDRELFAERATQAMLGVARAACSEWRPDLVVREPCGYASAVAAHEARITQAEVGISVSSIERGVLDMVTPIIERHGPGVAKAIGAAPYLTSFPASLDASPRPITLRFHTPVPAVKDLPGWWPGDERPLVYVTFGSVIGYLREAAGVYRSALDAVSVLSARVLPTVASTPTISARYRPTPTSRSGSRRLTCSATLRPWFAMAGPARPSARSLPACRSRSARFSPTNPATHSWCARPAPG